MAIQVIFCYVRIVYLLCGCQRFRHVGQREKPVLGHVLHFNPQVRPGRNYFFVYTYNSQNMSDPKIQSELL